MKISKLNESAVTAINNLLKEDVNSARAHVRQYLEDTLNHAFDNIAIAAVDEVEDYNAEWCAEDTVEPTYKKMMRARTEFLDAVEEMMFANATQNESITESVDMSQSDDGEEDDNRFILDEESLTEGPIKNAFRSIQNKIDPRGAKKRAVHDANKEEKKIKDKAELTLLKDFNSKNKDAKFYKNGDYKHPIDWGTWKQMYGDTDHSPESKEYAEWYNAIVTTPDGYYIRRGVEDLSHSLTKFIPGYNDKIPSTYKYDLKAVQQDSPEDTPVDNNKPEPTQQPNKDKKQTAKEEKPAPNSTPSAPTTQNDTAKSSTPNMKKFANLASLTGLKIYRDGNQVTNFKNISTDNLDKYIVKVGDKDVALSAWMAEAKKHGFLSESVDEDDVEEGLTLSGGNILNPLPHFEFKL